VQPRVGVGVFIFRDGKFLMGKRKGSHGEGSWSIPGGHLEFGETPEETAIREVEEETGLQISNVHFAALTNDVFVDDKTHYITIWMMSNWKSGEPIITEPDKYIDQEWFDFDSLPEPLFLPWQQLMKSEFYENIKYQLDVSKRY
jgi:8-oxo-dGTP diphosphatase